MANEYKLRVIKNKIDDLSGKARDIPHEDLANFFDFVANTIDGTLLSAKQRESITDIMCYGSHEPASTFNEMCDEELIETAEMNGLMIENGEVILDLSDVDKKIKTGKITIK